MSSDPTQTASPQQPIAASDARNLSRRISPVGGAGGVTGTAGTGDRMMEFRVTAGAPRRDGSAPARRLRLSGSRYTLGSAPGCSIQIPDARLRPIHAMLTHTGISGGHDSQGVAVRCFEESILVNGRSVRDALLSVGDVMKIGNHQFELLVARIISPSTRSAAETDLPSHMDSASADPGAAVGINNLASLERDLKLRRAALDARDEELSAKKIQYERQIEEATQRLTESQRQADSATEAVTRIRAQFESLNVQVDQLTDQQSDREQAYGIAQTEQQELQSRLRRERDDALESQMRELDQREIAERQLAELQALCEQTNHDLRRSTEHTHSAQEKADSAASELQQAESRVDQLERQLGDLEQRHNAIAAGAESAAAQLAAANETLRLANLELERAEQQNLTTQQESATLRDQVSEAREESRRWLAESQHTQTELAQSHQATEQARVESEQARVEAEAARVESNQAQADSARAVVEAEQARQAAETAADSSAAETARAAEQLERAELEAAAERSRRDAAESHLQTAQATAESIREELEQIRAELDLSRRDAENNAAEASDANDRLSDAHGEVARVEADLRHSRDRIEQLQQQAQRLTDTVEHAREESESLRQLYERSQAKVDQLQRAINKEHENASDNDPKLSRETDQLRTAMDQLSTELAAAQAELSQLRSDNELLQLQINQFQNQSEQVDPSSASDLDAESAIRNELANVDDDLAGVVAEVVADEVAEVVADDAEESSADQIDDSPVNDSNSHPDPDPDSTKTAELMDSVESDNPWPTYDVEAAEANVFLEHPTAADWNVEESSEHASTEQDWDLEPSSVMKLHGQRLVGQDSAVKHPIDDSQSDSDWDIESSSVAGPIGEDTAAENLADQDWDIEPPSGSLSDLANSDGQQVESQHADSGTEWDSNADWDPTTAVKIESADSDAESAEDGSPGSHSLASQLIRDLDGSAWVDSTSNESGESGESNESGEAIQSSRTYLLSREVSAPASDAEPVSEAWDEPDDLTMQVDPARLPAADGRSSADNYDLLEDDDDDDADADPAAFMEFAAAKPVDSKPVASGGGAAEPPTANEFSKSEQPAAAEPAVDDDSIEAYMNRLLGRVHGQSSAPAAVKRESVSMSSVNKPRVSSPPPLDDAEPMEADSSEKTSDSESGDGPIVPRSQAPEKNSNLSAMRQLANDSARSAISVSTSKQVRQIRSQALFDFGVAAVCIVIGLAAPLIASGLLLYMIWAMVVIASLLCMKTGISLWMEAKGRVTP